MFSFLKSFLFLNKCFLILFLLAKLSLSHADQLRIEKVKINGNQRLSDSFIFNFSKFCCSNLSFKFPSIYRKVFRIFL